jgi:hypothetical protein
VLNVANGGCNDGEACAVTNIRVMQWNIRRFSRNLSEIPGMLTALSEIIRGANPDIVIILEMAKVSGPVGLGNLCDQLRADDPANHWAGFRSHPTGSERYAFICRDLDRVRPLEATPRTHGEEGTVQKPLRNVEKMRFTTYPANFPHALPALPWPDILDQPLVALFYDEPAERPAKKRRKVSGQALDKGGYNLGAGGRMPCMAIFHIYSLAGNHCYLPIVVNHYFATRRATATNAGALAQIAESSKLHIAQKFAHWGGQGHAASGYLDIDNAAVPVQELMFTGDWNVDFLQNRPASPAPGPQNRGALDQLTPTQQSAGSLPIPLAPPPPGFGMGNPGVVQGPANPDGPPPAVPFAAYEQPSMLGWIPRQYLNAAVTVQGTILFQASPPATFQFSQIWVQAAAHTWELRPYAFDLTLFAGICLNTAAAHLLTPAGAIHPGPVPPASPADAAEVVDIPASIDPPGGGALAAGHFRAGLLQQYFANTAPGHPIREAHQSPNLNVAGAPLTLEDRWLGAQMVSDHCPTVISFDVP